MSMFLFFALPVGLLYVPWFLYTREKFSDSNKTTVRHLAFGLAKLNSTVNPIIHISRKTISGDVHYIPVKKKVSERPKKLRRGCVHQDVM